MGGLAAVVGSEGGVAERLPFGVDGRGRGLGQTRDRGGRDGDAQLGAGRRFQDDLLARGGLLAEDARGQEHPQGKYRPPDH